MSISLPTILLIFAIAMIFYERHRNGRGLPGRHSRRQMEREDRHGIASSPREPALHDDETERELNALRDRVKVLERITVDGRDARSIADEIESLRDK